MKPEPQSNPGEPASQSAGPGAETCCPPAAPAFDERPVEGPAADRELADLARALGHPARVQILRLLLHR
jgi:ArsR family transcriptional regulator